MAVSMKAARVNAGLTQEAAAAALEISKGTLRSYELYRTIPNMEMAQRMAALYNMTVDNIIFLPENRA